MVTIYVLCICTQLTFLSDRFNHGLRVRALRVLANLLELEDDEIPQHPSLQQENRSQAGDAERGRVEVALFPVHIVHAQVGETEPEHEYRQDGGRETRQHEQDVVDLEAVWLYNIQLSLHSLIISLFI